MWQLPLLLCSGLLEEEVRGKRLDVENRRSRAKPEGFVVSLLSIPLGLPC